VLTEELASAFTRLNRHPLWLRVGQEDRDPATFLLSVVTAARRVHADAGQATLRLMTEQPGPVFGWPPLFVQLAQDLRFYLATGGALVLEDVHNTVSYPTLAMLGRHLLPELDGVAPCVLVAQSSPSPGVLNGCVRHATSEFRLTAPTVKELLENWAPELAPRALDRAVALVGGRAAVLAGLRDLNDTSGGGLEPLLGHIASVKDLVARIAETLLADVDGRARCALGLATRIEYAHPPVRGSSPWRMAGCASAHAGGNHWGTCWASAPCQTAAPCTSRRIGCLRSVPANRPSRSIWKSVILIVRPGLSGTGPAR